MKSIVYTFGRMNPPTIGHLRLVDKVLEVAMDTQSDHIVYLSQSTNTPDNPLPWQFKHTVCEAAFPGVNISDDLIIKNPCLALESLKDNYSKITLVAGSDQTEEYAKRFTQYAEKWGIEFTVVSAGIRNSTTNSISATKLRQYAIDGKRQLFLTGLPSGLSTGIKNLVYARTRTALK